MTLSVWSELAGMQSSFEATLNRQAGLSSGREAVATNRLGERCLVVLGMHRSGTSAVAGELARLGAGFHADLLPADDANPMGYFESEMARAINEAIMQFLFGGWDSAVGEKDAVAGGILEDEYLKSLLARFERELLGQDHIEGTFCIKDPRLSRLLFLFDPIFRQHFRRMSYLLVVRNPAEVGASLRKRDQIGERIAAALWLRHIWEPLRYCAAHGISLKVVDYETALSTPGVIAKAAGMTPAPGAKEQAFLRPALRRNAGGASDGGREIDELNARIFEAVRNCGDVSDFVRSDRFKDIDADVTRIEKTLKPDPIQREYYGIDTIEQRRGRAAALLRSIENDREVWKRIHVAEATLEATRTELETVRSGTSEQIDRLTAEIERADGRIEELASESSLANARVEALEKEAKQLSGMIAALKAEADRVNGQVVILKAGANALEIHQSAETRQLLDKFGTSESMINLLARELTGIQEQLRESRKTGAELDKRLADMEARWYYRALHALRLA